MKVGKYKYERITTFMYSVHNCTEQVLIPDSLTISLKGYTKIVSIGASTNT